MRHRFLAGLALNIVGGVALLFAVLIIVGAVLIYRGNEMTGGAIVIVFSALSILVESGWLIGLILALVGGILGLPKKSDYENSYLDAEKKSQTSNGG